VKEVFDKEKIVLVPDHFTPNKDIKSAEQAMMLRDFARKYKIKNYFEVGRMGIEHVLLPEQGLIKPGNVIIGADSHTCTYGALGAFSTGVGSTDVAAAMATGKLWLKVPKAMKVIFKGKRKEWVTGKDLILYLLGKIGVDGGLYKSIEFAGEGISELSMDSRFSITNMVIEAGGKNGIMKVDDKVKKYLKEVGVNDFQVVESDEDASYDEIIEIDISEMELQVAFPHLPANARDISEAEGIRIDQVVIGSCTNGRMEDLQIAESIIKGKKVHPDVRLIVIPATQKIYLEAMKKGFLETFVKAGGVVSTPTCGPCLGGHMGILGPGEKAVSTTNRNFVGRMGHKKSEVYLTGPSVAAASAITGKISSPGEVMS
ncbi:MAG: 3-isopropylmalate dehydratase large subunit, partial [Actinomycetia bacterium]|nr:3-isopropylmalate dehydratase large subunit [Actinomycetes bacterium]